MRKHHQARLSPIRMFTQLWANTLSLHSSFLLRHFSYVWWPDRQALSTSLLSGCGFNQSQHNLFASTLSARLLEASISISTISSQAVSHTSTVVAQCCSTSILSARPSKKPWGWFSSKFFRCWAWPATRVRRRHLAEEPPTALLRRTTTK